MKKITGNILTGIALGSVIFLIICVAVDIRNVGNFVLTDFMFAKMAIGSIIVGLGFSLPSAVYAVDRLSQGAQVVIHMGIGCAIMIAVAFAVGWIPVSSGWLLCALAIVGEVIVAFAIWLVFFAYNKSLTKKMNERIQQIQNLS